jgi:DNA-binding beta-propeller fold protein YncE
MKFLRLTFIFCSLVFILESCGPGEDPVPPKATHLYFSDFTGKRIGVIDLNNLNSATALFDETDGMDTVSGMAIDFEGGKIYATEEMNDRIIRMNLDGSGALETLYEFEGDSVLEPTAITFDVENNDLLWANSGTGQIKKGSLDGAANVSILFDSAKVLNYCYGMVYDPTSKGLWYSDFGKDASIRIAPVNGSTGDIRRLFYPGFALRSPAQIVVLFSQGRIFWADEEFGSLVMGNLSNYSSTVIYDGEDGIERADGIAVDYGSSKIYWTDTSKKVIMRANLDGTGEQEVVLENVESYNIILKFDNQ